MLEQLHSRLYLKKFPHVLTEQLSCYEQNVVMIILLEFEFKQMRIPSKRSANWEIVSETDLCPWLLVVLAAITMGLKR